jgi:hypothetical protein
MQEAYFRTTSGERINADDRRAPGEMLAWVKQLILRASRTKDLSARSNQLDEEFDTPWSDRTALSYGIHFQETHSLGVSMIVVGLLFKRQQQLARGTSMTHYIDSSWPTHITYDSEVIQLNYDPDDWIEGGSRLIELVEEDLVALGSRLPDEEGGVSLTSQAERELVASLSGSMGVAPLAAVPALVGMGPAGWAIVIVGVTLAAAATYYVVRAIVLGIEELVDKLLLDPQTVNQIAQLEGLQEQLERCLDERRRAERQGDDAAYDRAEACVQNTNAQISQVVAESRSTSPLMKAAMWGAVGFAAYEVARAQGWVGSLRRR